MKQTRDSIISPNAAGVYYCTSRCVRGAQLSGSDELSGQDYAPRRRWIAQSIEHLSRQFAIEIFSYNVRRKTLHLVLRVSPGFVNSLSDEEVARRWIKASRRRRCSKAAFKNRVAALTMDKAALYRIRRRLGSISWFMRLLKQQIAVRANREDDTDGRFWEGQFKAKALLGQSPLLWCMSAVDLLSASETNGRPIVEPDSVLAARLNNARSKRPLRRLSGSTEQLLISMSDEGYAAMLQAAVDVAVTREESNHSRPSPIVYEAQAWLLLQPTIESGFGAAVGDSAALRSFARRTNRKWVKGVSLARRLDVTIRRTRGKTDGDDD